MKTRSDNPAWLAATITTIPILLAALLVWWFPPRQLTGTQPQSHPTQGISNISGANQIREKKKIRHYYGLHESQLKRFYALATKSPQNTWTELLVLCERRLDNAVRRASSDRTRPEARQGVCHGQFHVNGRKVDVASYLLKPGDVVSVAARANIQK